MLSKSQAKMFFIVGTVAFSGVFLWLTFDTMQQIPKQTNQQKITAEVKRGKEIWDHNNCMGCHTLLGEGAYYAPELTKAYDRRGPEWLKVFLKDPEAMFPGARKMTNYHFTPEQINDVVAFLEWISKMDLNGFPAPPTLSPPANLSGPEGLAAGSPVKFKQLCMACHSLNGKGGNVGPALDGVAKRVDAATMTKRLHDPTSVKPDSKMPKFDLSDQEIEQLVTFLQTLK